MQLSYWLDLVELLPTLKKCLSLQHGKNNPRFTKKQKAFYQYHSFLTEPWDGPAAIVASDGKALLLDLIGVD